MTETRAGQPVEDVNQVVSLYVEAFNSGNPDVLNRWYTDDAVTVWEPGQAISGEDRKRELAASLEQRPVMRAELRHLYVAGDVAMQVVDWHVDVEGPDGTKQEFEGVGLDVLVRGEDRRWRFAIDNPYEKAN
ncbi:MULTISPECIES: YybH family protein [unclassified Streptomyces]|uniref:YybH family protein n=1 Tax=unclassified Streptomyces TaxID=2593676 RepID=UPI0037B3EA30